MTSQRKRTTWSEPGDGNSREAATSRKADPYTMNQEHPQPGPTDYESGDPDAWAETPTGNENVQQEYEGERVKRNEVGLGEFREDTFGKPREWGDHKYENKTAALRKASAAERVARAILRTDDESTIGNQALDLMALPAKSLAATCRRLDRVSPDALPKEQKYRRALACCKLSARILGYSEADISESPKRSDLSQRLAGVLMSIDDPTLKAILGHVAASRTVKVAGDDEDEDGKDEKTGSVSAEPDEGEVAAKPGMREPEDTGKPGEETAGIPPEIKAGKEECGIDSTGCMCPEDMQMLDTMLQQEMGQPVPARPVGELTELFEGAPMPMAAPEMAVPAMASQGPDVEITFGDDGEERTASAEDDSVLADLFSDDPEVQAQRDIVAAQQEQAAREGGYAPSSRTASSGGARKLGRIQAGKVSVDQELEGLWDRPGQPG
jgi:hypothetical protein